MLNTPWEVSACEEQRNAHDTHVETQDLDWVHRHSEPVVNEPTGEAFAVSETRACAHCEKHNVIYEEHRILIPETQDDVSFLNLALDTCENEILMLLHADEIVEAAEIEAWRGIDGDPVPREPGERVDCFIKVRRSGR